MKRLAACLVVVAAVLLSPSARAEEDLVCEHAKLNTEDASTLDPGQWELELSYSLMHARRAFANDRDRTPRPLLREEEFGIGITYGLMEDLNVSIGAGYLDILDRSGLPMRGHGFTDLELGAKWRFYNNRDAKLEVAYTPAVVLPTGKRTTSRRLGTTDDFVTVYNGLALSKDWTGRATSNFDVGFAYPFGDHRGAYRGTFSANAAFGYHVLPWLQPEVELNYACDFNHGRDCDVLAATAGVIIGCFENVRIDLGAQCALCGRNADKGRSLLAAVTVAF